MQYYIIAWLATFILYYISVINPAKKILRKEADKRLDYKFTVMINDEINRFIGVLLGTFIAWVFLLPLIIFWNEKAITIYVEKLIEYYDNSRD